MSGHAEFEELGPRSRGRRPPGGEGRSGATALQEGLSFLVCSVPAVGVGELGVLMSEVGRAVPYW